MKIITAIGNKYLNEKLREIRDFEIIGKDIQYQDGIIEVLEIRDDINLIILSNELPEEYSFEELIRKIILLKKEIEIIVFLKEKNIDLENYLNSKKIYKIYYLNDKGYNHFFDMLNIHLEGNISKEINNLKNIILNENHMNIENKKMRQHENYESNIKQNKCETIVIAGTNGIGKSIVSIILADVIQNHNKKTLLIDYDKLNSTIKGFYNIKKVYNQSNMLKESIVKVSKNLDLFIFYEHENINTENEIEYKKKEIINIKEVIMKLKEKYEFIIIDINSEFKKNYIRTILYSGDKIIFLMEPNIFEVKKARNLLEIFINDYEIKADKIKLVFNKTNKFKIAENILEEVFSEFEIIGDIEYEATYNLIINKSKIQNYNKQNYEKIYANIKGE